MKLDLSVVIPLYDEEESLTELARQVRAAVVPLGLSWEMILVDDGSRDGSLAVCREIHGADPAHVAVLSLRSNQGKATALAEGFAVARGRRIVTLDADLQDDPAEIPGLLAALDRDLDLVSGWKVDRKDPLTKTLPSRFFNRVTAWATGLRIHDFNCGLKAYRREVTEEVQVYGDLHRYLPVLAHWRGFRVGELPVAHRPREHGRTKYGLSRFLEGFLDLLTVILLTRYDRKPLHLFGAIGTGLIFLGLSSMVYLVVGWFMGQWIGDRPLFPFSILLLILGLQFLLFGLLAELITASAADRRQSLGLHLPARTAPSGGSPDA